MEAIYGEEVRGSIYNALVAMNTESTNAMQFASTAKDSAQASAASAESSASVATQKATEAKDSASKAATSEGNAKISEQNAAAKATEAANSAAAAATSEQNAANSEAIARQKADEADASKSAAAQSAAEAAVSESTARQLRGETETFAAEAKADKEAANKAKLDAEAARDAAALSEQNAKASENTVLDAEATVLAAKDSAEAADADAQAAKEAAEKARDEAVTAKGEAETSAEEAAKSAGEAAASALSAEQYSGKPPKPDNTTKTWWIWDATLQEYVDSHIGSEIEGPQGVSIENIKLTSGDHSPGTADIYTVELSDGSSYNISVWNGRNGEGAGDVLGKSFDLVIPAAGWNDGQITIADERLIAHSMYKYFVGATEASREEYLDCQVRPKDITTTGFITFVNETDPEEDLTVSVIRFELSANG